MVWLDLGTKKQLVVFQLTAQNHIAKGSWLLTRWGISTVILDGLREATQSGEHHFYKQFEPLLEVYC